MEGNVNMKKAINVGVDIKNQSEGFAYSMEELAGLAAARHIEVVGELTQKLARIHKAHYLGKGKIEELHELIQRKDAEMIIVNDELTASQIRVLEEKLGIVVSDRTMLILDIFAERAKTREAQLQVEVARLEYMLPRLIGQNEDLGRQGGGVGLNNRGSGETKLELDRRKIEEKIAVLHKELEELVAQRGIQRRKRQQSGLPVVSLVGYTNAGKSTIMNAMVEQFNPSSNKQVFEKDMLFATLETSVRKIPMPANKSFLLTDTVGFVSKLPHHLVKAFRSTLEEVVEADLIIHVVDYSEPNHENLMEVTKQTLLSLGVENVPIIYALNKGDIIDVDIPAVEENKVYLSAKQRVGIHELIEVINREIFKDLIQCEMLIPFDQGQIVANLNEQANVITTNYEENGTRLTVECTQAYITQYQQYIISQNGNPERV
nr:GTPase HflX [Priestia megaterium]